MDVLVWILGSYFLHRHLLPYISLSVFFMLIDIISVPIRRLNGFLCDNLIWHDLYVLGNALYMVGLNELRLASLINGVIVSVIFMAWVLVLIWVMSHVLFLNPT